MFFFPHICLTFTGDAIFRFTKINKIILRQYCFYRLIFLSSVSHYYVVQYPTTQEIEKTIDSRAKYVTKGQN